MISGIGVDIVRISRIERVICRWGDRFIKRVFTPFEIERCSERPSPCSAFALRFAAKEAFSKAIGLGMRKGVRWRDIEIFNHAGGRPGLRLYGLCAQLCEERGVGRKHLSLSDDGDYGIAMVVLEVQ